MGCTDGADVDIVDAVASDSWKIPPGFVAVVGEMLVRLVLKLTGIDAVVLEAATLVVSAVMVED
jgi:hypothetical protein